MSVEYIIISSWNTTCSKRLSLSCVATRSIKASTTSNTKRLTNINTSVHSRSLPEN